MIYAKWIEEDGRFLFQDFDNGGVAISREEHAELFADGSGSMDIRPDEDGRPVLVPRD